MPDRTRIGFFLTQNFPIVTFSSAVEPMRAANEVQRADLYRWSIYTDGGTPVRSSSHILVTPDGDIEDITEELDILFVVAGVPEELTGLDRLINKLRYLSRRGIIIGAISGGVFPLAEAGLLDDHRCSVHWYYQSAFKERYPRVEATSRLFEIDRSRYTCAGGTAALDLMLTLMSDDLGHTVSNEISSWFQHDRIRNVNDEQSLSVQKTLSVNSIPVTKAISLFRQNIETPLSMSDVADNVGVTVRQLERLFKIHLQSSPAQYAMKLRLARARELLLYSSMPVSEIALAAGFESPSHFSRNYRREYGCAPSEHRRQRVSGQG